MRREQRERLARRFDKAVETAEFQTTAQQMMAGWFGGKLDAFLGFANRAPAYRGPTPKRTTRPRNGGTGTPYERPEPKLSSRRDLHRGVVAGDKKELAAKLVAQFFRTKLAMKHPPRRPILCGASFSLPNPHEKLL